MPSDESTRYPKAIKDIERKTKFFSQTEISNVFGRNKTNKQLPTLFAVLQTLSKIHKVTLKGEKSVMWAKI